MSTTETKTPPAYNIIQLDSQKASDVLQNLIDPHNIFRKTKVYIHDWKLRTSYSNHITKDMSSVNHTKDLYSTLEEFTNNLKRTRVYQSASVTLSPDRSDDSIDITVVPLKASRPLFAFSQFNLGSSYGIGGILRQSNLAGLLDTLSCNIVAGVYGPIKGSYSLVYDVPLVKQEFGLNLTIAKNFSKLSSALSEINSFQSISVTKRNFLFRFSHAWRQNLTRKVSAEKDDQEILPSRKFALSAQGFWDYTSSDKSTGNRVVVEAEYGSVENKDRFVKFRVKNDSFYGYNTLKSGLKGEPYELILENLFDFGVAYPLGEGRLRVNDRHFHNRMRGFSEVQEVLGEYQRNGYLGSYRGDDVYLRNTVKLYLNKQFPIFNVQFTPFVHVSYGYFSGNVFNKARNARVAGLSGPAKLGGDEVLSGSERRKSRYSAGIGLSSRLHPLVTCEFLVNMLSLGAANNKATVLQFNVAF